VTRPFVPVNEPLLDGNERAYLLECVESGWLSSEGPFVARFEEAMAAAAGRHHGVAVCNGSAALEAAVLSLRLSPGDEVILPSFTIISCATAVLRAGLVPVVVDSDPMTFNMTASAVEASIGPRTRAVMVVHVYGLPVDMAPILALAERHGLRVIEDAAELHGQTYDGRPCGSFGDVSTFSFYSNKHVTSGEGGMCVTDDPELAARLRSLRNLCFQPHRRFVHEELGHNWRMTNLQAAVGLAQLERLPEHLARKRAMGARYQEALRGTHGVQLPLAATTFAENCYWVFGVVLEDAVPFDADEAMKRLSSLGIGTRPFFWPMHEQPALRRLGLFAGVRLPAAERLGRRGFYLPSGLGLDNEGVDRSADALRRILS
jgi:perosamine synthetase